MLRQGDSGIMTANPRRGVRRWLTENFWVVLADAAGLLLLVSVLLAAGGSPALKEWLFVLLTGLPVIAALLLLAPRTVKPGDHCRAVQPIHERKIVICPRPVEQRTRPAA